MHILLTGAFGNIGSSTLQELLRQGHMVRCLVRKSPSATKMATSFEKRAGVEIFWSDICDAAQIAQAVQGQDVIIHLAAILPPDVDKNLELAEAVNVGGTRHLIEAALKQPRPPKFLFASSFDVFGSTQDQEPPRKVTDPIHATDAYSQHKITCEEVLKESGLEWAIFRFADVPPLTARKPDPIMFRIPLETRIEMLHTFDAALAIANGLHSPIWGKIWLIGGGKSCQVTYRDYLNAALTKSGIASLPDAAFSHDPYCTDWLDTAESQTLLDYQRHTFAQIIQDVPAPPAFVKTLLLLVQPMIRRVLLKQSPYWRIAETERISLPVRTGERVEG